MKPDLPLHALEREPIVYFGCTWSEIVTSAWRGAAIALLVTAALVVLTRSPGGLAVGLLVWVGFSYAFMYRLHATRAGKPLHYEVHARAVKRPRAPFIRAGLTYQSQRTSRPAGGTRLR
ncbi:MAG: DUF3487 family protein [bacterium]|nr:DUF3487 family protein [bacterium]